jgi:phosphoglycerate dehydrogenase-like enzyme
MLPRTAVLDDYQHVARGLADWRSLEGRTEVTVFHDHLDEEEALVERLLPFRVIAAMRERTAFPRRLLERLPELRLLVTTGMGNASIDLAAAKDRGVTVCGTGSAGRATPELTWALIHAFTRNLPAEVEAVQGGRWQVSLGGDLFGRTLGILGLGRIGQAVARVARAFEMKVIAWSQNLTPETAAAHGATLVDKETLFRESDILTIHLKLGQRTQGLVGASELALMRPQALLVNTSRGPIVRTPDLVAALREGRIAGAALDVFDREPLPADDPLRTLPNVILTPHIGYVTRATYEVFFRDTVEDIDRWLDGRPVRVLG